jgi:hypothetical protein
LADVIGALLVSGETVHDFRLQRFLPLRCLAEVTRPALSKSDPPQEVGVQLRR